MDADNVILLAQCLSNRAGSVYRFLFGYLGQNRSQRSWSAKKIILSLNIYTLISFKIHIETRHRVKFMCILDNIIYSSEAKQVLKCINVKVRKRAIIRNQYNRRTQNSYKFFFLSVSEFAKPIITKLEC